MSKIIFNGEEEVEIPDHSPIKESCEELGIPFACEEGICGTCIVEIEGGNENLYPMTQEEIDFLGEQEQERLACQCKIRSGVVRIRF